MYLATYIMYLATRKEGYIIKSRADYFRQRRKKTKAFYVEIDSSKMKEFEEAMTSIGKSKKEWLNEKINEELSKKDVENKK